MKLRLPKLLMPTESEIGANHAGMNMFFGAVLGIVMAGTERLDSLEFAYVLFMVSGIVISILYVSASHQKIVYSLLAIALILVLPRVVHPLLEPNEFLPEKLQPTLLVWTLMAILVEFLPRRPDEQPTPPTSP